MSCSICDEKFNYSSRKKIICNNSECASDYCLQCFKNYLLKSPEYSQTCLSCSTSLTIKDIFSHCNTGSFIKEIMDKVSIIALKNQKNILPESQPRAKIILNKRAFDKWRMGEEEKIRDLRFHINAIERNIRDEWRRRCGSQALTQLKKENSQYTFIKECSYVDCKGLLSTNWKCPLCEKFTCSKCHESKEDNHVCNEDLVKSIESLKRDSKPCPKCGTAISKIDGCDQMYCISCHTAFSWRTGNIEKGYIHNPEYFRYRRDNNLDIPRNPNAGRGFEINECFDPLEPMHRYNVETYFFSKIRSYNSTHGKNRILSNTLGNIFRYAMHTKIVILSSYRINLDHKLEKLRISYLVGDINEDKWISEIKKKTKEYHRNNAQYEIIDTFLKIWGDIIMNIIYIFEENGKVKEKIENQIKLFIKYLENTNKELKNIRDIFKSKERSFFQIKKKDHEELKNHPYEITIDIAIEWAIKK